MANKKSPKQKQSNSHRHGATRPPDDYDNEHEGDDDDTDTDCEDHDGGPSKRRSTSASRSGVSESIARDDDDDQGDEEYDDDYDDDDDEDVCGRAAAKPMIQTEAEKFGAYAQRMTTRQTRTVEQPMRGIATGLRSLDAAIGGMHGLCVIAGRTGSGKTSLALQLALGAMKADNRVATLYINLDMPHDDLRTMYVCQWAQLDHKQYIACNQSKEEKLLLGRSYEELGASIHPRMALCGEPTAEPMVNGIELNCRQLLKGSRCKRLICVIDLWEDLWPPADESMSDVSQRRLQQLTSLQSMLANKTNSEYALLLTAKMRKKTSRKNDALLDELLGTVGLGYKADQVMCLDARHSPTDQNGAVQVDLRVEKARFGVTKQIPLLYYPQQFRFEEPTIQRPTKSSSAPKRLGNSVTSGPNQQNKRKADPYGGRKA